MEYVRSQDQLGIFKDTATGLKLSEVEVLEIFGNEVINEVCHKGTAILAREINEPSYTLRWARERKNFVYQDVADRAGLRVADIIGLENKYTVSPMNILAIVCDILDLDVRKITFHSKEACLKNK